MAIIVEEERYSSVSIINLITWLVVIVTLALAAYYIFFKRPELTLINAPQNFEDAQSISQIDLKPEEVLENPSFRSLKQQVNSANTQGAGKANPLLGF